MQPKTFNELMAAILTILPQATIGEDLDGQLVIFTDLRQDDTEHNKLVPFEP